MATIVTRAGKGSALTHTEVDANFTNLNTDKVESSALATVATTGAYSDLTGTPTLATVATTGAYSDLTGTPTLATVATTGAYSDLSGTPTLATVATTGAYSDLSGTPTIPTDFVSAASGGTFTGNVDFSAGIDVTGNVTVTGTVDGRDIATNIPSSLGTAGQFLAVNSGASATEWIDAPASGTHNFTASGALANGDLVVINSDGTVSVVATTSATQSIGSATVAQSSYCIQHCISYDANAEKVVVAWRNVGSSNIGQAAVGTVSGTTITFGTPVTFSSNSVNKLAISYDAAAQKHLIAYQDTGNSNYGTGIVGTVSGTSISFGTATVFNSANTDGISSVYDPNAGKHVVAYRDVGNSTYGTAIIATISGTSVSFGSEVVFASASTVETASAYDSTAQKVLISYRDNGNSNYGTAIVGTVSGTSISFGSEVVYESAASEESAVAYDPDQNRVVIAYRDAGNSNYGTVVAGEISGTSVTFGTPVVFLSSYLARPGVAYHAAAKKTFITHGDFVVSDGEITPITLSGSSITVGTTVTLTTDETTDTSSVYDPNEGVIVNFYRNSQSTDYATGLVFQPAYSSTNLTATNYIGISDGAYADAATATIQIAGAVDDAQSGLTAGLAYYVQTDNTLSTTADSPSVLAGTAVSATEIIVKG